MHKVDGKVDTVSVYRTIDATYLIEYFNTHAKVWADDDALMVLEYASAPNGRRLYVEPYVDDVSWVSVEAWIDSAL